ncbi:hypothetical protein ABOC32_12645 [Pseudomonas sp. WOUb67]
MAESGEPDFLGGELLSLDDARAWLMVCKFGKEWCRVSIANPVFYMQKKV